MIKIGGYTINAYLKEKIVIKRNNLGEYHQDTQKIYIEKASTLQQKRESFIHEIIEAINSIYNLEIDHGKLTLLSTVLHQVFTDNEIEKYFKGDYLNQLPESKNINE